jgi:hypothetical protein
MGTTDDFVLDMHFADWVWNHIRASPRIYWPDDQKLIYITNPGRNQEKYYRHGTWSEDNWRDWHSNMGALGPTMTTSPFMDFHDDKVREVALAGTPYTTVGSWYTFEMRENADGAASFVPIRVPVPRDWEGEVRKWADDNYGRVTRVKPVEFAERYADALPATEARNAVRDMQDVHVRFENVESEREAKRLVEDATDYAERGARAVM